MKHIRRKLEPGQESVWDYPRPPRHEPSKKHIRVIFDGRELVNSVNTVRVLETSHPPVYYVPPSDIAMEFLKMTSRNSYCEWKGSASYYTIEVEGKRAVNAAWTYLRPTQNLSRSLGIFPFILHKWKRVTLMENWFDHRKEIFTEDGSQMKLLDPLKEDRVPLVGDFKSRTHICRRHPELCTNCGEVSAFDDC